MQSANWRKLSFLPHTRSHPANIENGMQTQDYRKKLQFIHMLAGTDLLTPKTAKIKSYITISLHSVVRQCAAV